MDSCLLVAYDAECPFCCSVADWAVKRDSRGLMVFFPIQNPELLRMAPELCGPRIHETIHGIDISTRAVFVGGALWLQMARRLPQWRWFAYLVIAFGLSGLARFIYQKRSTKRCRARAEWR